MACVRRFPIDALPGSPSAESIWGKGVRVMMMDNVRTLIALVLLVGTGWLLQARERHENIPPHKPLSNFPAQLGPWNGVDIPIDEDTKKVLGPGDFLLRQYENPDTSAPAIYL